MKKVMLLLLLCGVMLTLKATGQSGDVILIIPIAYENKCIFSIVCGGGLHDVCRLHGQTKSTIGCCFGKGDSSGSTESGSNG